MGDRGREGKRGGIYWLIMVDRIGNGRWRVGGKERQRQAGIQTYKHTHAHGSRSYMSIVEFGGGRDRNSYNLTWRLMKGLEILQWRIMAGWDSWPPSYSWLTSRPQKKLMICKKDDLWWLGGMLLEGYGKSLRVVPEGQVVLPPVFVFYSIFLWPGG
jgi:hypothetical protein